jgi:uncharacterized protein with FMN-binding domain
MKKWLVILTLTFATLSLFAKEKSKEAAPKYKDGVYKGSAKGYGGAIKVAVKVKGGKISKIKVLKHKESDPDTSLKKIPERIIKEQKTQVDAVTGATITSKAIMKAVDNALSKAKKKK